MKILLEDIGDYFKGIWLSLCNKSYYRTPRQRWENTGDGREASNSI